MAWRPHGRAHVNSGSPTAWGICDRCGGLVNHSDLQWQMEWRGNSLINTRLLVCPKCLDVPFSGWKTIVITADPVPILNARPENYNVDEITNITSEDGVILVDEDGNEIVAEGGQ